MAKRLVTQEVYDQIKQLSAEGMPGTEIAEKFGIAYETFKNALHAPSLQKYLEERAGLSTRGPLRPRRRAIDAKPKRGSLSEEEFLAIREDLYRGELIEDIVAKTGKSNVTIRIIQCSENIADYRQNMYAYGRRETSFLNGLLVPREEKEIRYAPRPESASRQESSDPYQKAGQHFGELLRNIMIIIKQ